MVNKYSIQSIQLLVAYAYLAMRLEIAIITASSPGLQSNNVFRCSTSVVRLGYLVWSSIDSFVTKMLLKLEQGSKA